MATDLTISPANARRLLSDLELGQELDAAEIAWALSFLHQIHGYEKIGIGKAAQDEILKGILIDLAREEINATSPKDLEVLIEAAEKREGAVKSTRVKEKANVKEFVKQVTPKPEKVSPEKTPPLEQVAKTEILAAKEPVLAVALTKIAGSKDTANFLQKVTFAPIKFIVSATFPARSGSQSAVTSYAIVHGITPAKLLPLKSKALALGFSEKQFHSFTVALSKRKFLVSLSDAVNAGRELSISPTQVSNLFLKPSADKSSFSVFRKPLLERILGSFRDSFFGKPSGIGKAFGKKASSDFSAGTRDVLRFLSGNAGRGSAQWGWAAAGGLAAGGLALSGASPALAAGFFAGAAGTSLAAGANEADGYDKLLGGGIAKTLAIVTALFTLTVSGIIGAIVIGMIATIGTVAIILFIINSGAYVVPPQSSLVAGLVTSPYIDVRKTVEGKNEFDNEDLPVEVTYKIEIGAKKGTLSNIRIGYECEVVKDGADVDCPEVDLPDIPNLISPTESFVFTYTHTLDSKYTDSFVIDTLTVTADAPEAKNVEAAASASVKIGAPPDDCPSGWPVRREGGEPPIAIYQGPHTSGGTHGVIEAIDIRALAGHNVTATHTGKVAVDNYGNYGDFVDITSTCTTRVGQKKTVEITTRYAHLGTIKVSTGQIVTFGQSLGTSDTSGTEEEHLHYEFRPDGSLLMETPYIPQTVPRGCRNIANLPCGVFVNN